MTNLVKWYIQKNINEIDYDDLVSKLKAQDIEFVSFFHIPFDNTYPDIDNTKPAFFYMAHDVTNHVLESLGVGHGVFYHTKDINIQTMTELTPELMWNKPFYIGNLKGLLDIIMPEKFFVRPAVDNKIFAGLLSTPQKMRDWVDALSNNDTLLDINSEIVLASALQTPHYEYRLTIYLGRVVTSSLYCINGERHSAFGAPFEVVEFAENFSSKQKHYLPAIYILDIGVSENKIGVIEANGIHNAGFYDMDKSLWIEAINRHAIEAFSQK